MTDSTPTIDLERDSVLNCYPLANGDWEVRVFFMGRVMVTQPLPPGSRVREYVLTKGQFSELVFNGRLTLEEDKYSNKNE